MAKKPTDAAESGSTTLRHNPFATLAKSHDVHAKSTGQASTGQASAVTKKKPVVPAAQMWRPHAVRAHLESRGRSGKVVTRVTGLPRIPLEAIASRLRSALGCVVMVEGDDVLLEGSLVDRASQWLARAGDLSDIQQDPPRPARETAPEPSFPSLRQDREGSTGSGTKRADIRVGARVAIVLKANQSTGKLTEGVVRDILTSSPTHPHGIKVRLESGEVGRVKLIRP